MIERLSLDSASAHDDTTTASLEQAYATCADITRRHSKSFYLSTVLLPGSIRRAMRAFYAFCRTTDDLVDQPAQAGNAQVALNEWRLQARQSMRNQHDPVLLVWADTRERYGVPQEYAEELIDGCEMDLRISRYETFDELRQYCYRVASTVGLVSMHIVGVDCAGAAELAYAQRSAIELGVALQLTNILRDVGEDLARGRIYLPQEDLRRFGYGEDDLRAGTLDERFRALMRFQIARTRRLYAGGWNGIACLKREGRLAVGAAISLYRDILSRIEANDFDVFTRRAQLGTFAKLARIPAIYLRVRNLTPDAS
jgi:15-cis-phytoene synthase